MDETKEEFEARYQLNFHIDPEFYHRFFVTRPCHCDYAPAPHWAAVRWQDPSILKDHLALYEQ